MLNLSHTAAIQNIALLLIALLIVIWRSASQVRTRLVTQRMGLYLTLMAVGLVIAGLYIRAHGLSILLIGDFVLYSLILPPFFGWLRVLTYQYWLNDQQQVLRRGNVLTILLWLIYFACHLLLSRLSRTPASSFILFGFGLSLLVQRQLAYRTASRKFPEAIKNNLGAKH